MNKLTKIINGVLGAGMNRRTSPTTLTVQSERIWDVRRKHNPRKAVTRVTTPSK